MTRKRFREEVEKTADAARKSGWFCVINHKIPFVSVNKPEEDSYFFQGEEASKFIDECPKDLSVEDWLLWQAQGW